MSVSMAMAVVTMVITLWCRCMINWGWSWSNIGDLSSPVSPSVWKVGSSAGEDISASSDHVFGEGKLLAIENQCISVLPEAIVAISALFLQSFESVPLVINLSVVVIDAIIIAVDVIVVVMNVIVILVDAVFNVVNFVVQIDHGLSDSFKGNHKLCFGLDPLLILNLVPDWVPFVEVTDLVPEVTLRYFTVDLVMILLSFIA